ncbi:MAG: ferrous iron transport protein A [Halobacteriaceae archaeon]
MTVSLSTLDRGEHFDIDAVGDPEVRAKLLRLGFLDGTVECHRRVPNGPVVLRRNGTTLAIGHRIAEDITVTPTDPT